MRMRLQSAKSILFCLVLALLYPCSDGFTTQPRKTAKERADMLLPTVSCSARGIRAEFGSPVNSNIHVKDGSGNAIPVPEVEGPCGVRKASERNDSLTFFSRYDSCYALFEGGRVVVPLQIQLTGEQRWYRVNISCPLIKSHSQRSQAVPTTQGKCDVPAGLRVRCGPEKLPNDACSELGCCYDAAEASCYYRPDTCSLDGHFVFSVTAPDALAPLDPGSLRVKGQPQCVPAVITADTAVFKISVTECGATMKVDEDVTTYEVEVEEPQSESKAAPLSLRVLCQYDSSALKRAADLRSSYAVTQPPPAVALGTIRVQMRIATDASFASYFAEEQLPLRLPLRQPVYVEVSIVQPSPDPTLTLRVEDCFAYPASRHSVWTLLYDGCPNPMDDMRSSVPVDNHGRVNFPSQFRRFDVKTFAFLDPLTGQPSSEEMYFYCWVEICTEDVNCSQSCSIISSEGERPRRDVQPESSNVQLVSIGPLLGGNSTEAEGTPCPTQNPLFQVTVGTLSAVSVALLLILLLFASWIIRRRQRTKEEVASNGAQPQ